MTGPLFQVHRKDADRLRLVGALDLSGAAPVRAAVADCFARRPDRVVVELWDLRFCDCAGLNALLEAKATADMLGAELRVEGARAQVARLFALTGADEVFANSVPRLPPRTV
ncbi:STAS domain-containing protein [Streptomyces sp. NPDC058657]|uniref:STAS domain-containing protein n=1 Tax=unclassified Streptomyces TaxID=2593676 RepID=UPI00364CD1AF